MRALSASGILAVSLACATAGVRAGQIPPTTTSLNPTVAIKQFLHAAYPDLDSTEVTLSVCGENSYDVPVPIREWSLRLERPTKPARQARVGSPPPTLVMTARVGLGGPDDFVEHFSANGPFVNDARRGAFAAEVRAHHDWTDGEYMNALRRSGARFGPSKREAVLARVSATVLAPFLAGFLVHDARFVIRDDDKDAVLAWVVELQSNRSTPWGDECLLWFEPFDGRLFSFHLMTLPPGIR